MTFFKNESGIKKINLYAPWVAIVVFLTIGGLFFLNTILNQNKEKKRIAQNFKIERELTEKKEKMAMAQAINQVEKEKARKALRMVENFFGDGLRKERISDVQRATALEHDKKMRDLFTIEYCIYLRDKGKTKNDCKTEPYTIDRSIKLSSEEKSEVRLIMDRVEIQYYRENLDAETEEKINIVLSFYRSAISCVDGDDCSSKIIFSRFKEQMRAFVNKHCNYFGLQGLEMLGEDSGKDDFIVNFLLNQGLNIKNVINHDPTREAVFRCSRHREMERMRG